MVMEYTYSWFSFKRNLFWRTYFGTPLYTGIWMKIITMQWTDTLYRYIAESYALF